MTLTDALRLFDAVVDESLAEPLEKRMRDYAAAIARGDSERARRLNSMIVAAITLGYHAVVGETWKRRTLPRYASDVFFRL